MAFVCRILLVDDHQIIRDGLKLCLEQRPGWSVVGEAETANDALIQCARLRPDVIVVDIGLPGSNGIDLARAVVREYGDLIRVLMLSAHESGDFVREALRAGARGYVHKRSAFQEVAKAIDAITSGRLYVSPSLTGAAMLGSLGGQDQSASEQLFASLSPREREVLQLLAEGNSSKQTAARLGISYKTVHVHRTNLMHKLDLQNDADLVKFAIRAKLTSSEG